MRQGNDILYVYSCILSTNLPLVGEATQPESFEELGRGSRVVTTIARLFSPPEVGSSHNVCTVLI